MFSSRRARRACPSAARSYRSRARLWLVALEERIAPANLVVTDAADNGGPGQLRAVLAIANSNAQADTITFDSAVTAISLTSVLPTYTENQNLTIAGNGKTVTTINAPPADRVFDFNASGATPTITIKDLTLKGGNSPVGGAIRLTDEPFVLANVKFTQNTAASGGAIAGSGVSNLTITGCDFTANVATEPNTSTIAGGGGIYLAYSSSVTITNTVFDANQTRAGASAISAASSLVLNCNSVTITNGVSTGTHIYAAGALIFGTQATVTIDHSTITGNSSRWNGGAMYGGGQITVTNSIITSNTAGTTTSGGGIGGAFLVSGTLSLANDTISNNTATSFGGAIRTGGSLVISNSIFAGNTASSGGAIYSNGGSVTINTSVFSNNTAFGIGGAVVASGSISFCDFASNRATGVGGALSFSGTISNSTLRGNSSGSSGGALNVGTNVTVNQCTFTKNTASGVGGGAIVLASTGTCTVNNSTIYDNTASSTVSTTGGGGILRNFASATVIINSSIIAGNKLAATSTKGRDLYNSTTTFTLVGNNSLFGTTAGMGVTLSGTYQGGNDTAPLDPFLNSLADNGGALLADGNRIKTMSLQAASPALHGGNNSVGFQFDQRGSGFPRHSTSFASIGSFEANWMTPDAILLNPLPVPMAGNDDYLVKIEYRDDAGIDTSTIDTNDITVVGPGFTTQKAVAATYSGSGASVTVTYTIPAPPGGWGGLNPSSTFNVGSYSVTVNNNQVADADAAVHFVPGNLRGAFRTGFGIALVVDSLADVDDGNYSADHLTFREAVKVSNQALSAGANAITFSTANLGSSPTIPLSGGTIGITNSLVITGPQARVTFDGQGKFQQMTLDASKALTISNVNFTNYSAATSGGALSLGTGTTTTLSNSSFSKNTGTVLGGGAIAMAGSALLSIAGCAFVNNAAWLPTGTNASGGAIFASAANDTVTIDNSAFTNNYSSGAGGAISAANILNLIISNSAFSTNTSNNGAGGGAIWQNAGTISVSNVAFSGNTAAGSGGAIYMSAGTTKTTVLNSQFSANSCLSYGGAVYVGGNVVILRSSFTQNTAQVRVSSGGSTIGTGRGGAIALGFLSSAEVRNCTLSGNSASNAGGGLFLDSSSSIALNLSNSVIVDNRLIGSSTATGGGIFVSAGKLNIESCVIADNVLAPGGTANLGPDISISSTSTITLNTSLVGVNAGFTKASGSGNQIGAATRLGPLADNGGPTFYDGSRLLTRLPGPGSPVRDSGSNSANLVTDERGAGYPRLLGSAADMGAIESLDPTPIAKIVDLANISTSGNVALNFDVIYRAQASFDSTTFDSNDLTVTGPGYSGGQNANLTNVMGAGTDYTVTYSLPAPIGGWGGLNGNGLNFGTYSISMNANQVFDTSAVPLSVPAGQIGTTKTVVPLTLTVDNSSDVDDGNYGPGQMSLREAINLANLESTTDTINFNLPTGTTIKLNSGFVLSTSINIAGLGADKLTIDANQTGSIFGLQQKLNVQISGLKLTGGSRSLGGAILTAAGDTVTVSDCWLQGNTATASGSAIYALGSVIIRNCTFSNNVASVLGTVLADNGSTVAISNSTFINNTASSGGAIYQGSATVTIKNSTITANSATDGGGIRSTSPLSIESSIIAGNTASNGPDIYASSTSITITAKSSLIGQPTNGTVNNLGGTSVGASSAPLDARFAPFEFNAGTMPTIMLRPGSPALDMGSNPDGLAYDQRGAGFPRQIGAAVDMGAVEGVYPRPISQLTATPALTNQGAVSYAFTVVYADDSGIDTTSINTNDVTVTGKSIVSPAHPASFHIDAISAAGDVVTVTYTLGAPSISGWQPSDDGIYTITLGNNEVRDIDVPAHAALPGALGTILVAIPTTYVVDELSDIDDGDYTAGHQSLREAIKRANTETASAIDTITFAGNVTGTLMMGATELVISDGVVINGPGSGLLTIDANHVHRHFYVSTSQDVALSGLSLINGQELSSEGGSIESFANKLLLSGLVISSNQAYRGGGIYAFGSVNISDSQLTANTSASYGGGGIWLYNNANLTVTRSVVSGNQARNGGGIYFLGNGSLIVSDSAITANKSTIALGGGIYFNGSVSPNGFRISNSTISGNTAASSGGGVVLTNFTGNARFLNTTIANNQASTDGGIARTSGSGTVELQSTIVAANNGTVPDLSMNSASTIAGNNNLIGVSNLGNFTLSGANNKTGSSTAPLNPMLYPVGAFGGPTPTQGLKPGSPAINMGANPDSLTFDQRGPGFPRVIGPQIDIGAVEGIGSDPAGTLTSAPTITTLGAKTNTFTVLYTDDIGVDTTTIGTADVLISGKSFVVPVNPVSFHIDAISPSGDAVTVTYTVAAPNASNGWTGPDNGVYTITLAPNQISDVDVPSHFAQSYVLGTFQAIVPSVYVVDELSDINDGNFSAGHLSFREAITLANTAFAGTIDTITFAGNVTGTLAMTGVNYTISDGVVINGPGAGKLTIDAANGRRHFIISGTQDVSLSGLTLVNGSATATSGAAGGAINGSPSKLTLTGMVIKNCVSNLGGGISIGGNSAAVLTLVDCQISGNKAIVYGTSSGGYGAGILISGGATLIMDRSAVFGNKSDRFGGGIYFGSSGGGLSLTNSAVTGNSVVTGLGGGVYFRGTVNANGYRISNTTISSNSSSGNGAGITLGTFASGTFRIANSTITGNLTTSGSGGGIYRNWFGATVQLQSTIVAGNLGTNPDISFSSSGTITANNNLIGVTGVGNFTLSGTGNKTGTVASPLDPMLDPLGNYGGPTLTHRLKAGSPAINVGSNPDNLANDQRGPGFARIYGGQTDIGAYEVLPAPPTVTSVVFGDGTSQRSLVKQIVVSFSEPVNFMGGVASSFTLHRSGSGGTIGNVTLIATPANGPASSVTITFTGSLTDPGGSLKDGLYNLIIGAAQVSGAGGSIDGNGDGIAGGDYVVTGTTANKFYRLFGDSNGDGGIDQLDYLAYRNAIASGPNSIFDFDNNGDVDQSDYFQFRQRISTVP
ncbi:MAG: choice-of-anchor Q domain-containing protein [Gemmataceae bacterium]